MPVHRIGYHWTVMTWSLVSVQSLGLSPVREPIHCGVAHHLIQTGGWSVHQCSFGNRDIDCYSSVFPQGQREFPTFLSAAVVRATVVAVWLFPRQSLGWPMSVDGAVRQFCMHKKATIQELDSMLKEFDLQRSSVEINRNTPLWSHNSVWNRRYMDPKSGYTLQQLWKEACYDLARAEKAKDGKKQPVERSRTLHQP